MGRASTSAPKVTNSIAISCDDSSAPILSCLDRNDFQQAYELLTSRIQVNADPTADHLLAGVLALQLGRPEAAESHFLSVLKTQPTQKDALYNLALLNLSGGNAAQAYAYFGDIRRIDPADPSIYNDMGVAELERNRPRRAVTLFRKAMALDPNFRAARNNAMETCLTNTWTATAERLLSTNASVPISEITRAEINRWREVLQAKTSSVTHLSQSIALVDKKIAVFASHDAFIRDVVTNLNGNNQVRAFEGDRLERMQELLRWADVAWFEWCDQMLIAATQLPKTCRIICRLHSYEAFTDMPAQVDWSKVDQLVYVNKSVQEIVGGRIPASVPTRIIHNGVDLNRFSLPNDKPTTKKIASVGYINYKKNPSLLLYAFKKIHEYDSRYTLHIAGQHQDPRIELYMTNFLNRHPLPVYFEGWIDDMPAWYRDKQYVISTSLFESFHYSIAEGMSCGCIPLVHDWYGADNLYPADALFGDPDECVRVIKRSEQFDLPRARRENRAFIADRYRQESQLTKIRSIIGEVLTRRSRG